MDAIAEPLAHIGSDGITVESAAQLLAAVTLVIATLYVFSFAKSVVHYFRVKGRGYHPGLVFLVDGNNSVSEWVVASINRTHVHAFSCEKADLRRDIPLSLFLNSPVVYQTRLGDHPASRCAPATPPGYVAE
jgi:hypothetical protein